MNSIKKTAIITGANRGIGLATVKKLASQGMNIYACARTENADFEVSLREIASDNQVNIEPIYFDLADRNAVQTELKALLKREKQIDILVNNAGISDVSFFLMTPISKIENNFRINFFAQLEIVQLAAKVMRKNRSGSIVNICSTSGIRQEKGGLAYGSSKAALIYATGILAHELGEYNIRVNSVSPGFIDTDLWKVRDEKLKDKVLSETPLGRQGTPEDVANAIAYLVSEEAAYITGQNLIVDGGRWGG